VAGASAKGDLGELHEPETHVIPNALRAARTGTPFQLFGDDFPTRDGTCERDYVHVEDLARAHRIAVERLDALPPLEERGLGMNLGTGRGSTVREVVAAVEQATGTRLDVKRAPRRAGDPPALVADAGRARELLGFKAEHDLGSMVRSALAFMERHAGARGGQPHEVEGRHQPGSRT
jgi:UDP-glucose 4-epimerase